MAVGGNIKARVFLEGVEVPFIGASITSAVNQASIAYIDIVPLNEIRHIKPRTHVVIAVLDYFDPALNAGDGEKYILAWEGEVFGYNFGRTASSRTMTLNCIDYSSYWDNVLVYYFDPKKVMNKAADLGELGFNDLLAKKTQIATEAASFSNISYYLKIFEDTLKEDGKDELDAFVAIFDRLSSSNVFYDFSEKRFRISERFALASSGAIENLLQGQNAIKWFQGVGGTVSGFHSMRQLVMMFLGIIFHDVVPVPFPARVRTSRLLIKDKKQRLNTPQNIDKTIGQFVFKPNIYMCAPPVCNVFYPDEYSSFQFSRNFFQEPTRLAYQPHFMSFQGGKQIVLDWAYQPESFKHYMKKKLTRKPKEFEGDKDFEVTFAKTPENKDAFPGFYKEDLDNEYAKYAMSGKAREHHFLTNEELYKGVILAQEGGFPASSSFTANLDKAFKQNLLDQIARYSFYKKRYQTRGLQITSHLKTSIVPGFPVLIIDDSEAQHHVVAYCNSVTHRIYATEGGFTNVNLSYARTVDEQDTASNKGADPFLPNWFLSSTFGALKEEDGNERIEFPQPELAQYYASVLGDKGSSPITSLFKDLNTIEKATNALVEEYNLAKSQPGGAQALISKRERREYVTLEEAFAFIGATPDLEEEAKGGASNKSQGFQNFKGNVYDLKGTSINKIVENKRAVTLRYQSRLKATRGIRG